MRTKIQQIFDLGWADYCVSFSPDFIQEKAARSIMSCKSEQLGYNISICSDCNYIEYHYNSCRSRNCPNCQAVLKELWIDKRRSEVIDSPYFHVVFTVPAELNPLIYANQSCLYSLLHKCSSETILELASSQKYLGAVPGIIQVLHTWGQELNFHPHIHCIVSGGGITKDRKLKVCGKSFFIPAKVLAAKFRGKLLAKMKELYQAGKLSIPKSCHKLQNHYEWNAFIDRLYKKAWCPDIRETFNGFGNAIEYLGRYAHRIAITNKRIISVSADKVVFWAKDYKNNSVKKEVSVTPKEFIRRFMMHILPKGFQKIRYYGFLNNRWKNENLNLIFKLQGHRRYKSMLSGLPMDEVLLHVWNIDIHICPVCGRKSLYSVGRTNFVRD